MIHSEWDPMASWPTPLPKSVVHAQALVGRLRKQFPEQSEDQNDIDEACHLIEQIYRLLYDQAHERGRGSVNDWISFKDRPPENGQKILVHASVPTAFWNPEREPESIITAVEFLTGTQFGGVYFGGCGYGGWEWEHEFRPEDATHWMPLPPAPGKGAK